MFFINLYEILNSIDLTLEKNIKLYNNSFIDNFIDELKKHLAVADSMEKLSKIPANTLFTLDRYEGDYAVCENRTTGKMYDIPRLMVDPYARDGDILKLENGTYTVDYIETEKQREIIKNLIDKVTSKNGN